MINFVNTLSFTMRATAPVKAYECVGFDGAPVTAADAPCAGIALSPAKVGEDFAVMLAGWCELKVSAPVNAGDQVVTAAAGGVSPAGVDPANVIGRALAASQSGFVPIKLV